MKEKEPGIAAALNIIPGVGYIYINKKRTLGWLLFATILLVIASFFDPSMSEYIEETDTTIWTAWDTLGLFMVLLPFTAFIVDGYQEAKRHNACLAKKK